MPDALTEARRTLEREREALEAQLERIEAALTALTGLKPPSPTRPTRRRRGGGRPDRLPRGALAAAIAEVLRGAPPGGVHGDEVLAQLEQRGVVPRGANPKASVRNALQRLTGQGRVQQGRAQPLALRQRRSARGPRL